MNCITKPNEIFCECTYAIPIRHWVWFCSIQTKNLMYLPKSWFKTNEKWLRQIDISPLNFEFGGYLPFWDSDLFFDTNGKPFYSIISGWVYLLPWVYMQLVVELSPDSLTLHFYFIYFSAFLLWCFQFCLFRFSYATVNLLIEFSIISNMCIIQFIFPKKLQLFFMKCIAQSWK